MYDIMMRMDFGKLILVRHGETVWAKNKQYTGRTDIPLTPHGKQQAQTIAADVAKWGVKAENTYVSPLLRAQQTALEADVKSYKTEPLLAEWDYGKVEGHKMSEVTELRGNVWDIFTEIIDFNVDLLPPVDALLDDNGKPIPVATTPGESVEEVVERTRKFLDLALPTLSRGENVLCVAHAHLLRVLALEFLSLDVSLGQKLRLDNCSISVLTDIGGFRTIEKWNVTPW